MNLVINLFILIDVDEQFYHYTHFIKKINEYLYFKFDKSRCALSSLSYVQPSTCRFCNIRAPLEY